MAHIIGQGAKIRFLYAEELDPLGLVDLDNFSSLDSLYYLFVLYVVVLFMIFSFLLGDVQ